MNQSAARSKPSGNLFEGQYRPVWAATWRTVQVRGRTVYFDTAASAECAAWRKLYETEQRVMHRDGEIVISARAAADRLFARQEERA